MKYFFEIKENEKALKRILDEWLDTPFRHHCGVKGKGTDCIHFPARVFEELGKLKWRKDIIPEYAKDWHLHRTEERLMNGILKELKVEKVNFSDLMNGDIILFQYGRASAHASIYYDKHTYQAINGIGVKRIAITDQDFKKRMKYAFRLLI